ncbi:MAG: flagellar biosynthesis anti-sigma factor FlgM [Firmicutes bacterium]|nr:flagellar biosynthesis anti-sigma factor FlgM [Bacillota bacterium]
MKINRPEIVDMINKIYRQEQLHNKNKPAEASQAPQKDRVEISSGSEALKKEIARSGETDPSRLEKITEISRQVEAGEYKIDSRELAAIILKAAKDQMK